VEPLENRYWCVFGTTDPADAKNLSMTCQINPPTEGVIKSVAGMFAIGQRGQVFLTHSGKVGGGRRGVGQTSFLDQFRGRDGMTDVQMPDGSLRLMIVVGRLDDPAFTKQVGHFVHEVERVKRLLTAAPVKAAGKPKVPRPSFSPEFAGKRQSYHHEGAVEADARHGLVVGEMARFLRERQISHGNDRNRDLYVLDMRGRVTILFEAKTAVDSTSIYTAVGQLMLNGKAEATDPRRVLVVPAHPDQRTGNALDALGIDVVTYRWLDDTPVFTGLQKVL
jgi:hypothetical protein